MISIIPRLRRAFAALFGGTVTYALPNPPTRLDISARPDDGRELRFELSGKKLSSDLVATAAERFDDLRASWLPMSPDSTAIPAGSTLIIRTSQHLSTDQLDAMRKYVEKSGTLGGLIVLGPEVVAVSHAEPERTLWAGCSVPIDGFDPGSPDGDMSAAMHYRGEPSIPVDMSAPRAETISERIDRMRGFPDYSGLRKLMGKAGEQYHAFHANKSSEIPTPAERSLAAFLRNELLQNWQTVGVKYTASQFATHLAGKLLTSEEGGVYAAAAIRVGMGGNWYRAEPIDELVRALDVALNGEAGAAPQAKLSDVVSQVQAFGLMYGSPLLVTPRIDTRTIDSTGPSSIPVPQEPEGGSA